MKKFVFSLQKLYDVKESEEEQKRLELKELDKKLDELIHKLNQTVDIFNQQKKKHAIKCKQGIGAFELKSFGDYFQYLIGEIAQLNDFIVQCEEEIDICRQALLKLMNEKKVLDRMRDEQLEAYNVEIAKFNEKEIEDFMQGRL